MSVSLEEDAAVAAEQAAAAAGMSLSAWLSRAALRQAKIQDGLRAAAEWRADHEAVNGPIPAEEFREAGEILDRYGVGRDD